MKNKWILLSFCFFALVIASLWISHSKRSSESLKMNEATLAKSNQNETSHGENQSQKSEPQSVKTQPFQDEGQKRNQGYCSTFHFQHLNPDPDRELEEYLEDSNQLELGTNDINSKTICVKVNGRAVPFKQSQSTLTVKGQMGPKSLTEVYFCSKSAKCIIPCEIEDDPLEAQQVKENENSEDSIESELKIFRKIAAQTKSSFSKKHIQTQPCSL